MASDGAGERGLVLVVEDEPDVREIARLMLVRGDHDVIEAGNGAEAVEVVRDRGDEIGVVLLDVMMPRMTGHEALPRIRELVPDMPVVFFSGYDRGEVAEHLDGASVHTTFLPKPFAREDLLAAVGDALSAGRGRGASARGR